MTLDHYSPCPCGNGKKLKFCKCVDQPQEYEKILKLIEGGQAVAAIDRINQLLQKTPNAAWLLAIKGELSLSIQEIDSFKETANRFLKLKPDNPLALVMKSIVSSLDEEPVENAARYLLEGMAESREAMPALTLSAIKILIRSLVANNKIALVGYWSDVLAALTGSEEGPDEDSAHVDPSINLLAKAPAKIIDDPAGAEWKERLAEVLSLARTFRFAQAESKLRAILRDYPDQPGPLSHLLRAQCAQLDQEAAFNTAKKLSEHLELSLEDRSYFGAVALELEPLQKSLQAKMILRYCEIADEDKLEASMRELDFVECPDGESIEQVRRYYASIVGDEVPAKRIFGIFDKSIKNDGDERELAASVGTAVLYGKQTDKPSRALLIAHDLDAYQSTIETVATALELGDEVPDADIPVAGSYVEFLNRPKVVVGEAQQTLSIDEQGTVLIEDVLAMKPELLDGKTVQEAAKEEPLRGKIYALLYHLEGEQSIVVNAGVIGEIYSKLDLEMPQVEVDPEADSLKLATVLDMERIDITALNDRQLKGLVVRAMGMGASRVFYRCAQELQSRESMQDDTQLQVAALSGLLSVLPSVDQRIELCGQLEELLAKVKAPVGKVVIQKMSLLHAAGRHEEAQQALMEGAQKYPGDPYLMSFIQYAMQAQGGGMPGAPGAAPGGSDDLAMRMMQNASRQTPSESDSGLVLPGQDRAGGGDGESKLWLPGS